MYILLDNNGYVTGLSETEHERSVLVPSAVALLVEQHLNRRDVRLLWKSGDLLLEPIPTYWQRVFDDTVKQHTSPSVISVGNDVVHIRVSDIPILVGYANSSDGISFYYEDAENKLHNLTRYEYQRLIDDLNGIQSGLMSIRHSMRKAAIDSEERYKAMLKQLAYRLSFTYGRDYSI